MQDVPLASRLEGLIIDKWKIIKKRLKTADDNSGVFSSCYEVENVENGQTGFLKAINYKYAFNVLMPGASSIDLLHKLTASYQYEKELLDFCNDKKMSRIVSAIAHGEYRDPSEPYPVPYLVFEIASGSLKNLVQQKRFDLAWKLGAIHGFLVGLSQLHQENIVHQDIKPSNILVFGQVASKLSDLGNATKFDKRSPLWDGDGHCGDMGYAPIELLYGYCSVNWQTRRLGADLFMAGGVITYLITDSNFLTLMISNTPETYRPLNWGGSFDEVKPHILQAYNVALAEVVDRIDSRIREPLGEIIAQLTHPIPEQRGIPRGFTTSLPQYSLQRYISIVDRLAKMLEWGKDE
ncbi:MAG: protein kinase [Nitrospirota bacterium]|nr:protein kinase [Nitrospirota bacterium]